MGKRITKDDKSILFGLGEAENGIAFIDPKRAEYLLSKEFVEQNPGMVEDGKLATRLTDTGQAKLEELMEAQKAALEASEPETEQEAENSDGGAPWASQQPEPAAEDDDDEPELDYVKEDLSLRNPVPEAVDATFTGPVEVDEPVEVQAPAPVDEPEEAQESDFELEKGIPVPVSAKRMRGSYKYPFEKMEVGDSFHIAPTKERPKPARTLASTVSTASKKFGKLFRVRTVDVTDPKGPGARVFRLE